jgi:hypothetical protein
MKSSKLLGVLSCAAVIVSTGSVGALELKSPDPVLIVEEQPASALNQDLAELLYFAPSLSVFDSAYAPELGAGLKWRGVGDPRLNVSVEGSAALYQPGSAGELWIGSRVGFVLHDASRIELVGSSAVGLIEGIPSYRGGLGIEIPVARSVELVIEGVIGGHFGQSPTDNGIRVGLHFFPGAL